MYIVVRTHSHTDRQCLWKVLSRPIADYHEAVIWMEFERSLCKNKKHKFMVVSVVETTEESTS